MFKVKKNTKMSKIFAAYNQRMGLSEGTVRFNFDGCVDYVGRECARLSRTMSVQRQGSRSTRARGKEYAGCV